MIRTWVANDGDSVKATGNLITHNLSSVYGSIIKIKIRGERKIYIVNHS